MHFSKMVSDISPKKGMPRSSSLKADANTLLHMDNSSRQTTETSTNSGFLKLPLEIREQIYVYASHAKDTWIGSASCLDYSKDVADDSDEYPDDWQCDPSVFVKTKHRIILANHQFRDEYRVAFWRHLMNEKDGRLVDIKMKQLVIHELVHFFACCSAREVEKLLQKEKCRIRLSLRGVQSNRTYTHARLMYVQKFCQLKNLSPEFVVGNARDEDCIELGRELQDRFTGLDQNRPLTADDHLTDCLFLRMWAAVQECWSKLTPGKPLLSAIRPTRRRRGR